MPKKRAVRQPGEAKAEKKVNKTKAIHDYLKSNPKARNKEVVEALGKQGIEITANYVAGIKTKTNTRRKAARDVVSRRGLGVPEVKAALVLLKECRGSMAEAGAALEAAQEIRELV
jgi:hypothetical protein